MGAFITEDVYVNIKFKTEKADEIERVETAIQRVGRQEIKTQTVYKQGVLVGKKITESTKRFRMELLSVMFAGQQMSKTFGGMTQGALELTGVTEVMNTAMNDVMITALEPLLPMMYDFAEGIMNMSDSQKTAIGSAIMLGQVMGTVMGGMGQVLLFVDGLKEMGGLAGLFKNLTSIFGDLGNLIGKPLLTTIGVTVPDDIKDKFSSALTSKWGKVGIGLVGGIVTIDGLINMQSAKASEGLADDLYRSIETAIGTGMVASAIGFKGKQVAFIGITAALIANDVLDGNITAEDMWKSASKTVGLGIALKTGPAGLILAIPVYFMPEIFSGFTSLFAQSYAAGVKFFRPGDIAQGASIATPWGDVKQDFISRGGQISSFSPDDTIIGMKDFSQMGGGTVINVTVQGNASRETADEIARQVDRVLNDSMKRMAR